MARPDLVEVLEYLAAPLAAALGVEIWGVEVLSGNRPVARIFVDAARTGKPVCAPAPVPMDKQDSEAALYPGDVRRAVASGAGNVTIDQCAELSRQLGLAMDVEEAFVDAWTLEVSSPGFERPFFRIDQMRGYEGRDLEVTLSASLPDWPDRKKFRGMLHKVDDETFSVSLDPATRRAVEPDIAVVPWSHVRRVHLIYVFVEPEKPGKGKGNGRKAEAPSGRAAGGKATRKSSEEDN